MVEKRWTKTMSILKDCYPKLKFWASGNVNNTVCMVEDGRAQQ